jgi:hypothetical protein
MPEPLEMKLARIVLLVAALGLCWALGDAAELEE